VPKGWPGRELTRSSSNSIARQVESHQRRDHLGRSQSAREVKFRICANSPEPVTSRPDGNCRACSWSRHRGASAVCWRPRASGTPSVGMKVKSASARGAASLRRRWVIGASGRRPSRRARLRTIPIRNLWHWGREGSKVTESRFSARGALALAIARPSGDGGSISTPVSSAGCVRARLTARSRSMT